MFVWQGSDGGAIFVENGSSATFDVTISFEGNTVEAGYSGGVLYAGGEVSGLFCSDVKYENSLSLSKEAP